MGNSCTNPQIEKEPSETEKYVDKLLQNNNINLSFLPDSIERKIYIELLTTITSLLENVVETTEVKFLDKRIIMKMENINDDDSDDSDDSDSDDSDSDDSDSDSDDDDDSDDDELDDDSDDELEEFDELDDDDEIEESENKI